MGDTVDRRTEEAVESGNIVHANDATGIIVITQPFECRLHQIVLLPGRTPSGLHHEVVSRARTPTSR